MNREKLIRRDWRWNLRFIVLIHLLPDISPRSGNQCKFYCAFYSSNSWQTFESRANAFLLSFFAFASNNIKSGKSNCKFESRMEHTFVLLLLNFMISFFFCSCVPFDMSVGCSVKGCRINSIPSFRWKSLSRRRVSISDSSKKGFYEIIKKCFPHPVDAAIGTKSIKSFGSSSWDSGWLKLKQKGGTFMGEWVINQDLIKRTVNSFVSGCKLWEEKKRERFTTSWDTCWQLCSDRKRRALFPRRKD